MRKVALVHDWLVGYAGGEKVLEAITGLYPAPIYTLIHNPKAMQETPLSSFPVHTSFLQALPKVSSYYRNLLPLFPLAIERLDLSKFDLILSSSHAVAKGVMKRPDQIHICYCHTPMRYAWDLSDFHLQALSRPKRALARGILPYLRHWDEKSSSRVDHFIANSQTVADRIYRHYGRNATVIHPPVDTERFLPSQKREDYYFTCSRFVPYKRIDLLIQAFNAMPHRQLVIAGGGPDEEKLKQLAGANVQFLGPIDDQKLSYALGQSRAFLFAAEEDFGIVSVEAQSAGIPVIAYGKGGSCETVLEGKTGLFFDAQEVERVIHAIERFEREGVEWNPTQIRGHALNFSKERFQQAYRSFVEKVS